MGAIQVSVLQRGSVKYGTPKNFLINVDDITRPIERSIIYLGGSVITVNEGNSSGTVYDAVYHVDHTLEDLKLLNSDFFISKILKINDRTPKFDPSESIKTLLFTFKLLKGTVTDVTPGVTCSLVTEDVGNPNGTKYLLEKDIADIPTVGGGGGGSLTDGNYGDITVSGGGTSLTVNDNSIDSDKIQDNAITEVKILDEEITTNKIRDNAVTEDKISAGAVTNTKLGTGIDTAKLGDGSVSNTELSYLNGVTSAIQTQLNNKAEDGTVIKKDGSVAYTGNQSMSTFKLTDLGAPNANGQALRYDELGVNNGIATLDAGGKIPVTQLPNSVMELQGSYNANTNTPSLIDGVGNPGDVYEVTVAGTRDFGNGPYTFAVGDWVVYGADGKYYKSLNSNEVTSVNSQTGAVSLNTSHIPENTNLYFTDSRAKSAAVANAITDNVTDVAPSQDAVFEALLLKAPLASPALTGNPTAPTQAANDNSTKIATTAYVDTTIGKDLDISTSGSTSYGITTADFPTYKNRLLTITNALPITATIPNNASQAIPIGGLIALEQGGNGQITFVGDAGVTLRGADSAFTSRTPGAIIYAIKVALNTWLIGGDTV